MVQHPDAPRDQEDNGLYRVMHQNLQLQKQRPQTSRRLPQASFDGPFFTLQEVKAKQRR